MIVSIVAVILAGAAFAIVGYPLYRGRAIPAEPIADPEQRALEDLQSRRENTYAAIKELDFDYEMGNLVEADYKEVRERLHRKAAGILHDLDALAAAPPAGRRERGAAQDLAGADEIERAVRRRRARQSRHAPAAACSGCGSAVAPGDQFCATCGAPAVARCAGCGAPIGAGDRFCATCGVALLEVAR